ncbi:hypothetical protein HON71_03850 [Candidatus Woesearchaeota archaeon]|jgi:hypothetical protein|nr:hypothetical protein [Candidatus Woesearchaeota archaeon]MBT5342220.1 hypothetical protein [Candidatus Woesearchaeota archaeon]
MAITYFNKDETIDQKTSEVVKIEREIGFSDVYQAGTEKLRVGKDFLVMICEEEDSNELSSGHDQLSTLNNRAGGLLGYDVSQLSSNVGNLRVGISVGAKRRLTQKNGTSSDLSVIVSTKVIDKKEPVDYSLLRKMEEYLDQYQV